MNTALTNLLAAAANDEAPVSAADVVALSRQYPFFTLPAVMLLRREGETLAPELRTRLMQQIALNAPDAEALSLLADPELDEWRNLYPIPDDKKITTSDAISTFLNRYGPSTPQEDALLEKLIFNPTPDYASILARDEVEHTPAPADDNSNDALIDNFIRKTRTEAPRTAPVAEPQTPAPQPVAPPAPVVPPTPVETPAPVEVPAPVAPPAPAPAPKPAAEPTHHPRTPVSPDTSLSESLAKIYIRQKRYDKAFEIIHTLSLNNPKKSVYFADQLRFLRKLMLNRNLANGENKL